MNLSKVIKRDGRIENWDITRVQRAILGALCEEYNEDKLQPSNITLNIANSIAYIIEDKFKNDNCVDVETIHNVVEQTLKENGYEKVAEKYHEYRLIHEKLRECKHDENLLSDYIIRAKYSRYNAGLGRRENWEEICERVKRMHLDFFSGKGIDNIIHEIFEAVEKKKVLPSMRSLQFGGEAILKNHARMYNCAFTNVDRLSVFGEIAYLLLSGCGVGFSVQEHHIDLLPNLPKRPIDYNLKVIHHTVEDTIEGWANAFQLLINSYWENTYVEFNYSNIRKRGAILKTSGGKAPGHLPLKKAIENIRKLLDNTKNQNKIKPIQVYDIIMHIADAVVSGGVRRSATICLFSLSDTEMLNAKTGNWFNENPQRARSNISVVLNRKEITKETFQNIINRAQEFGEPGIFFSDNPEAGTNPCAEIGLLPSLTVTPDIQKELEQKGITTNVGDRISGVQMCNLTTINAKEITSENDFFYACKIASYLGTLQAAYTNFNPPISPITKYIVEREALLGVSICGILDNPNILLNETILKEGAEIVKKANLELSQIIGINPASRTTCVKPEGTTSLLLNTSSGISPHHSKRYWRRVRASNNDPIALEFARANPGAVEIDLFDPSQIVLTFPIQAKKGALTQDLLSPIDMLNIILKVQKNWVLNGISNPSKAPNVTHNVSNTILFSQNDIPNIINFLWNNKDYFSGISLLPKSGDKIYPQAPREALRTSIDLLKWLSINYINPNYDSVQENTDNTNLNEILVCSNENCNLS